MLYCIVWWPSDIETVRRTNCRIFRKLPTDWLTWDLAQHFSSLSSVYRLEVGKPEEENTSLDFFTTGLTLLVSHNVSCLIFVWSKVTTGPASHCTTSGNWTSQCYTLTQSVKLDHNCIFLMRAIGIAWGGGGGRRGKISPGVNLLWGTGSNSWRVA